MSSVSTTDMRARDKRPAVPVLLESFPVPPSFIPPSPLLPHSPGSPFIHSPSPLFSPIKQPLSAPPTSPLPPVPGPSPITEHETLMFISAARSRRASKISLASVSTYSQRDSIISADGASLPSLSPSASATPYDSSRSIRSYSSSSSLSVPLQRHVERSPIIQPRIAEEDAADLTRMSLDEISMHSPLPENLSDDEKVLDIGVGRRYDPRDSISSVDVNEIPPLRDESDAEAPVPSPVPVSKYAHRRSTSSSGSMQRIQLPVDKALPPLPPPPPSPPPAAPHRYLPRAKSQSLSDVRRPSSPDIKEILATTPRPRRKSSHGEGLRSRSTSRSAHSLKRRPSDFASEARSAPASRRTSAVCSAGRRTSAPSHPRDQKGSRPESPNELAYEQTAMAHGAHVPWDEDSFVSDYGAPLDETGTPYDVLDGDEEARLDKELDGEGSGSDSDLDLHTPLPQLMVRDGMLSPNSKLVASSRGPTPLPGNRPGSVFSVVSAAGSVMTKNGLFKDERDTVQRRVRHRDGKLLRGGIGLTTGLGWSDSEDEDAPSPLTRQLSSGSLKNQMPSTSSRSLNSVTRSYSDHMPDSRMEEFGMLPKLPRSLPPTSWQRPRLGSGLDRRPSTSSSLSSGSSTSAMSRTLSRTSTSSFKSAPGTQSNRRGTEPSSLNVNSLGHIREGDEMGFISASTSSSTTSLVTPVTPADSPAHGKSGLGSLSARKTLAKLDTLSAADLASREVVSLNSPPRSAMTLPRVPRPLRLPQAQSGLRTPDAISTRTPLSASAGPSIPPSIRRIPSQGLRQPQATARSTSRALSVLPQDNVAFPSRSPVKASSVTRSSSAGSIGASMPKLRPRTGTGMVYRTSPNTPVMPTAPAPAIRPTMMRMPSSTSLRSAKGVGVAI